LKPYIFGKKKKYDVEIELVNPALVKLERRIGLSTAKAYKTNSKQRGSERFLY
jgi:hypothetical protein